MLLYKIEELWLIFLADWLKIVGKILNMVENLSKFDKVWDNVENSILLINICTCEYNNHINPELI